MTVVDSYIYPINGKITRTVVSNNLTVAVKNYDGNDFSAGGPLVHKIGDTPRSLSGALSVTVNAGTNTFNAGSTALAAKEVDFFTYLGWRASNTSMFILISRIPYATTYADFSTTATNEKYGAYSGGAPASTDPVINIGRFNATNSGTASYNWSVPATSVIVHHPIFETRLLSANAIATGFTGALSQNTLSYSLQDRDLHYTIDVGGTSNDTTFTLQMVFAFYGYVLNGWAEDNGLFQTLPALFEVSTGTTVNIYKDGVPSAWTNTNTKRVLADFVTRIV